jgi:hypothetical protein
MGTPQPNDMDPIQVTILAQSLDLGRGWLPTTTGELTLALGDDPVGDPDGSRVMSAFDPNGGYAALIGVRIAEIAGDRPATAQQYSIGGAEIVRYSGWSGNALRVVERDAVSSLPTYDEEVTDPDDIHIGARGFVFEWEPGWIVGGNAGQAGTEVQGLMNWQTYILPISVSVPGATQLTFLQATTGLSQFAQITELAEPERTEWVRYDDVDSNHGQLVRSSQEALRSAYAAIFSGASFSVDPSVGQGGGGPGGGPGGGGPGGGGPGGGGGGSNIALPGGAAAKLPAVPSSSAAAPTGAAVAGVAVAGVAVAGVDWDPFRGEDPNADLPLTRAVAAGLHFRGVLGTETGAHGAGTRVVPVFQLFEASNQPGARADGGMPGAFDPVFLVGLGPGHLGWPMRVHRAHLASTVRPRYGWQQPQPGRFTAVEATPPDTQFEQGDRIVVAGYPTLGRIHVALDEGSPEPILAGGAGNVSDSRLVPRLVKFPSGELPRFATSATVGAGAAGARDLGVASASVDEVAFGHTVTFSSLPGANPSEHTAGASLVVQLPFDAGASGMTVEPFTARVPNGRMGTGNGVPALSRIPQNGGLLRVGEEIVAYYTVDPPSGGVAFATGGRGLLGTQPQPHQASEPVSVLEHFTVSMLAGDITADDATIPLVGAGDFPPMGLVLIDGELIHYTRIVGSSLDMPRRSNEPGAMDERGGAPFRGRFGTTPAGHSAGTPVVLFPFRYWDRYALRFDGPEAGYFGLHVDQPDAWWRGVTFEVEDGRWGGTDLVVLQRTRPSVPWDSDPEATPGLVLLEDGTYENGFVPIGAQSDRIEWRALARYRAGAFDPYTGLSHGWKESPRLRHLAVTYFAPGRVLRSVDR